MPPSRHCRIFASLLVGVGVATTTASRGQPSPRVTIETVSDEIVGQLAALDSSTGVRLKGDSNARLSSDDVLVVRFDPACSDVSTTETAGSILLTDRSRFRYRSVDFVGDRLRFTLRGGVAVDTTADDIADWRLGSNTVAPRDSADPADAADVLFVRRPGDETATVSGVVLAIEADGVRFALNGDAANPVVATWDRVAGIRFFRGPSERSTTPRAMIKLVDGGVVAAEAVTYQAGRLSWQGEATQGECDIDRVASIDLSADRVVPVRQLEVLQQDWQPSFAESVSTVSGMTFDEAFDGTLLTLRRPDPRAPRGWPAVHVAKSYSRGVAMRSQSEVRFGLPENARRLKGLVGLDPASADVGSADVTILADDSVVWSGVVDGTTQPIELNADLASARSLSIRVGYGDNLDTGDNVHFAALRVVR
ncbi:MAG: NPCBM/NEW2 domain-containing protein [Planctomycetota bacterium]